ncbi:hypothetical protein ACOSQ3_023122 [Xanthoceras sorbifolium]
MNKQTYVKSCGRTKLSTMRFTDFVRAKESSTTKIFRDTQHSSQVFKRDKRSLMFTNLAPQINGPCASSKGRERWSHYFLNREVCGRRRSLVVTTPPLNELKC